MRRTNRVMSLVVLLCLVLGLSAIPAAYGQEGDTETDGGAEGGTDGGTEGRTEGETEGGTKEPVTTHVVQAGENLFRIALKYGVTVQAIADANNIANPNLIYVGQELTIPGGATGTPPGPSGPSPDSGEDEPTENPPPTPGTYTVVAGDTLSSIAREFGTTYTAIAQANNITNVNLITVGQVLIIPSGTPPPEDNGSGSTTPPPDSGSSNFELGGHVNGFGNIPSMQQAGMTWAKVQIRYKLGDNTDAAAQAINDAHLAGFKSLLGIVGDPAELSGVGLEAYITQFSEYLGNVASLGPYAIEVWNEPNIDREWPAGQINPQSYTRMLQASYGAIKAANGNVMVISGAPAPTGFFGGGCTGAGCDDKPFLVGMAQAGAANAMDCIGAHYNEGIVSPTQSSGDPRGNGSHYTRYFSTMLDTYSGAFGGAKPVCWTELGFMTMEGLGASAPAGFEWGENNTLQEHAIYLGEAAQLSRSSGRVRLMIVWNVNFSGISPDPMGAYAIVRPGGSCPACATLGQAMQ